MFFKNASPKGKKNVDISCRVAFIFWGLLLLVSSTYEFIYDQPLINSSLIILISGLVVFFATDFILRFIKRN